MARKVEEIFVTEGVPDETFVEPPNYGEVLVDVRHPGKLVIIEGQSGTGKTTTVRKILERLELHESSRYLSARQQADVAELEALVAKPRRGLFVVDDFHRLSPTLRDGLGHLAKVSADQASGAALPKLIVIGINEIGAALLQIVPDSIKRCGVHRIEAADQSKTRELVDRGCRALNVEFDDIELVYQECRGDYWLTQQLCQTACTLAGVFEEGDTTRRIPLVRTELRRRIIGRLEAGYSTPVKEFCRGRRFRSGNDPYFRLLRAVAEQEVSNVDLIALASARPELRPVINNVKDRRLLNLLHSRRLAARYFYFNEHTARFSVEDPAMFYYLKHLDWERLRAECGFRADAPVTAAFDVAISFAGENRELARFLAEKLEENDLRVFFDQEYAGRYLGTPLSGQLIRIYARESRFVLCLLDAHHAAKVWPSFERDCFAPRIPRGEVIPVYLDATPFPAIPQDLWSIHFRSSLAGNDWQERAEEEIVARLLERFSATAET